MLTRQRRGWGAAWQPHIAPDSSRNGPIMQRQIDNIRSAGLARRVDVDRLCLKRNRCAVSQLTKGAASYFLRFIEGLPLGE